MESTVLLFRISGGILCPPVGRDVMHREFGPLAAQDMSVDVVKALVEICDLDEVAAGVRIASDATVHTPKSARHRSGASGPAREHPDGWATVKTATILDRWNVCRITATSVNSLRCSLARPRSHGWSRRVHRTSCEMSFSYSHSKR
eukprot:TRINITY_DN7051_c0_g2_i1.p3 TRINITY_DN7051_c0_g2~~TRINITY_DN7051_c0_g2_i1.p3  ORF type:complete len:146 (-),score=4.31 TRINITY_DN7051_c0_g2_i1:104-541(-)